MVDYVIYRGSGTSFEYQLDNSTTYTDPEITTSSGSGFEIDIVNNTVVVTISAEASLNLADVADIAYSVSAIADGGARQTLITGTYFVRTPEPVVADIEVVNNFLDFRIRYDNDDDTPIDVSTYLPTLHIYAASTKNAPRVSLVPTYNAGILYWTYNFGTSALRTTPLRYRVVLNPPSSASYILLTGKIVNIRFCTSC